MKMQTHIARRIFWNVLISLMIYALPIILMFLSFYFSGDRPWRKKTDITTADPAR